MWYDNFLNIFKSEDRIVSESPLERVERKSESINEDMEKVAIERIRETLRDRAYIISNAEDPDMPEEIKYHDLFSMYRNIEADDHVFAVTELIFASILMTDFGIFDKNGDLDPIKTKLLKRSWFFDYIKYSIEAEHWMFSLIQLIGQKDGAFDRVENVNRYHVRPKGGFVSKSAFQADRMVEFRKAPYADKMILIESDRHLGIFNYVSKKFILKREVEQFWAVFNELFTAPTLLIRTKFSNAKHRKDLLNMVENRKHSNAQIVDLDDEITELGRGGAGFESYRVFEENANKSISKVFTGQTMTFEDGSSRSQAEVHSVQQTMFMLKKKMKISIGINEELLPRMIKNGSPIAAEDSFKWIESANISVMDWSTIISSIATVFDLDETEVSEKIGLKVKTKEQQIEMKAKKEVQDKMDNLITTMLNQS